MFIYHDNRALTSRSGKYTIVPWMGHGNEKTPAQLAVLKTLRCFTLTIFVLLPSEQKWVTRGPRNPSFLSEAPSKQLLPLENRPEFLSDRKDIPEGNTWLPQNVLFSMFWSRDIHPNHVDVLTNKITHLHRNAP